MKSKTVDAYTAVLFHTKYCEINLKVLSWNLLQQIYENLFLLKDLLICVNIKYIFFFSIKRFFFSQIHREMEKKFFIASNLLENRRKASWES